MWPDLMTRIYFLHNMNGWVRVLHSHGAPGSTVGKGQVNKGSVMLWAMFCWDLG